MPDDLQTSTVTELLKKSEAQLFGKYRGRVVDNNDPETRGRLKLEVPSIFGTTVTDWVIGAFPFGGNSGEAMVFVPAIGSQVLVEFIEGDKSSPVWTATYFPADGTMDNGGVPTETFDQEQGHLHLLRTESGIEVRLEDDRGDTQQLVIQHPKGGEFRIDPDGIMSMKDGSGAEAILDPANNIVRLTSHSNGTIEMTDGSMKIEQGASSITMDESGITLTGAVIKVDGDNVSLGKNASAPVMNAQAFVNAYIGHVHPCPTGSTSPPAPPNPALLQMVSLMKVTGA